MVEPIPTNSSTPVAGQAPVQATHTVSKAWAAVRQRRLAAMAVATVKTVLRVFRMLLATPRVDREGDKREASPQARFLIA